MKIPKYNEKGGEHFMMFMMKFKAYAAEKNLSAIMLPGFKASLPATEGAALDETQPAEKKQIIALGMNTKGVHALIMVLETPEMMNKIMLEQQSDTKWPNWKFSKMMAAILADELPDNAVAEMKMEDDLRKLKLPKDKDPKELHTDMAAVEVQYKCKMTEIRKG